MIKQLERASVKMVNGGFDKDGAAAQLKGVLCKVCTALKFLEEKAKNSNFGKKLLHDTVQFGVDMSRKLHHEKAPGADKNSKHESDDKEDI